MNNTRKAISGTELVESILGGPNVDHLLNAFHNKEHAVLEFKASWKPCEGDAASEDDCRWNVIKSILAMANASGGCIILGIAENKSGKFRDSGEQLSAGDFDPDHILKNPKHEEKDLIEHTLSGLFKGDGFFRIKTNSGRQEKLKVGHFDSLTKLVEPVKLCSCKAVNGRVLVLVVHPCKDDYIYVYVQHDVRADVSRPQKVLFYRDSELPKTHRIDDIEEMAKYCRERKIKQPNYQRILENSKNGPVKLWKTLAVFAIIVFLATLVLASCLVIKNRREAVAAYRIAEDARQKEEEAQRKADDAAKEVEKTQEYLTKLEESNTATKKQLDDAKAKLEAKNKEKTSAELAAEAATKLAMEAKEKANNALASYKRLNKEREQWNSYREKVKNAKANYRKDIKEHCAAFNDGLNSKTNSVCSRFDSARNIIPEVVKKLTEEREHILNLVKNAVDDQQQGKTGNHRICGYINSFLNDYFRFCFKGCESLVDDGKKYEGGLHRRFLGYKNGVVKTCSATLNNEVGTILGQQVDSCQVPPSMFPEPIFKEDKERIERTGEAIANLIIQRKSGKKAIRDMKDLLEKYPGTDKWQKTDVSSLQKELGPAVAKELSSIVDELQKDAIKHVSRATTDACDAYLKAGDGLAKTATKKP